MKDTLVKHVVEINKDRGKIEGYAVAVVGTKRTAYLKKDGETTYNEKDAAILSKSAAITLMNSTRGTDLYKYTALIPTSTKMYPGSGLPTVSGY